MLHFLRSSVLVTFSKSFKGSYRQLILNKSTYSLNSRCFSSEVGIKIPCKLEAVRLNSRSLIKLRGEETLPFLQGLITNDIAHLESRPAIYALFLNHQGRVLWDTNLFNVQEGSESQIFIECDSSIRENLIKHLKTFKLRRKIDIEDVNGDKEDGVDLWVIFDHGHTTLAEQLMKEECCGTVVPTSKRPDLPVSVDPSLTSFGDPRLSELGWRVLVPRKKSEQFPPKDIAISDESSYRKLRYVLGVAEGVKEIPPGSSFPLEANGDYLHGVSFHKGCYVGQELTARTHHTGVVRKRIMPIRFPEEAKLEGTDPSTLDLINSASKRPVGKIRGICGSTGIGLIRIEDALAAPEVKLQDHNITVQKPFWWPKEASKDKQSTPQ